MGLEGQILRIESDIKNMRKDLEKLQREEDLTRVHEQEAIRHVQLDAKRKIENFRHHRETKEREIKYKEQELARARADQAKQAGGSGSHH